VAVPAFRFRRPAALRRYLETTASARFAAYSAVFLLLLYEACVRVGREGGEYARNAIDLWLRARLPGPAGETGLLLAGLALLAGWAWPERGRRYRFRGWWIAAFAGECALWALLCVGAMWILRFLEPGALASKLASRIGLAAGAGVFEEATFRLALAGGLYELLGRTGLSALPTALLSVCTSAFAFALSHVFGGLPQPLSGAGLLQLSVLGLILGFLFLWRGLAAAMFVHAFYDVFVLTL